MIPKIIHCCWFGGPKTQLASKCLASWRLYASDWAIHEWSIEEVRDKGFELGFNSAVESFFDKAIEAKKWSMASDFVRMLALYAVGGVYFDFDVELISNLESLPSGEWVAGEKTALGEVWMASGAGIALRKCSEVALGMINAYEKIEFDPAREMMPWINGHLSRFPLQIIPPEIMCPIGVDGRCSSTSRTVAIHHYAMSWASPKQRLLKWLSWHGMRSLIDFLLRVRRFVRIYRKRKRGCF